LSGKIEESVRHREILPTDLDLLENKYQFLRYLERIQGRPFFPDVDEEKEL
jgi:hypothetical protein